MAACDASPARTAAARPRLAPLAAALKALAAQIQHKAASLLRQPARLDERLARDIGAPFEPDAPRFAPEWLSAHGLSADQALEFVLRDCRRRG